MSQYKNWTKEQINTLLSLYGKQSIDSIAEKLNKSVGSIYKVLHAENVLLQQEYWTEPEIALLRKDYATKSNQDLRLILNRSEDAIQFKAASLGLKKTDWWNTYERNKLVNLKLAGLSSKEIGEELDRDPIDIHNQLVILGLTSASRKWTKKELGIIHDMVTANQKFTFADIAAKLNATVDQIIQVCNYRNWKTNIIKTNSHGEDLLLNLLTEAFPKIKIIPQFNIGDKLRLDFLIPDNATAWEYDGIQHFIENEHFHRADNDFAAQKFRDREKENKCTELGVNIIRIKYDEKLTLDLIVSKFKEIGPGKGSDRLDTIISLGGYKTQSTIKTIERSNHFKQINKERGKLLRKAQYQKSKLWKAGHSQNETNKKAT